MQEYVRNLQGLAIPMDTHPFYPEGDKLLLEIVRRINKYTRYKQLMKEANQIIFNPELTEKEVIEQLTLLEGLQEITHYPVGCLIATKANKGFSKPDIVNNSNLLRQLKKRYKYHWEKKAYATKEYYRGNIRIEEVTAEKQLLIFYPIKPPREVRARLHNNNFTFSKTLKAYYSPLNNTQLSNLENVLPPDEREVK